MASVDSKKNLGLLKLTHYHHKVTSLKGFLMKDSLCKVICYILEHFKGRMKRGVYTILFVLAIAILTVFYSMFTRRDYDLSGGVAFLIPLIIFACIITFLDKLATRIGCNCEN